MDTSIIHGGTRSLSLQFDADGIPDVGVYQLIPVEASTPYSLRGFMRSEELESANGVRLGVTDYYSNSSVAIADEIIGSTSWREVSAEFTTGPDTHLLKVGILRSPSHGRIRGKLWIDDLRMEKRP
jgi:hypothetical protein